MNGSEDARKRALRKQIAAETAAWEAAGGKIQQVPIGASGIKGGVYASYAKAQASGLKKIRNPKNEDEEDDL
jgi:hypothetical protein